ncbi:DUF427 domain-containing protein [Dictyobacter arantiisoli]|uniref:DUF427 domain-containing protein n=1 Tax=Dictyobacter arantiisoli TaxID=2014874 RepID=A0A5A5TE41_9CHLR|nr:DUF427 domain-containing protein [Dictyobacter arantiisoli]GCF09343.1 hypothetical protein KDI_29070 [Dictyobacter arantiisoli]
MLRKRIAPGPGQESVWDYPRPPRLEDSQKLIQIVLNGIEIAHTQHAKRVLETSQPPTYYIPPEDVKMEYFIPSHKHTYCEWKGTASYYTITVGDISIPDAAWYYQHPSQGYEALSGYIAVYPSQMDACYVAGEKVQSQAGNFYGGWITSDIVGPFKGGAGTMGW